MSVFQTWLIALAAIVYTGWLFAVAFYGDRQSGRKRALTGGATVYALSLGVYATSWTYYGSVGRAATSGVGFLPIYLGPTLMFALGYPVLTRITRISKRYRITSLADFVSARYGKSAFLGGLVTVIAVIGVVPYIALQLKAVSDGFEVLRRPPTAPGPAQLAAQGPGAETTLVVALLLAAFAILFGTRHLDTSERHSGMVTAIAFDSIFKLLGFVAVGVFVAFQLFHGFHDLFSQAAAYQQTASLFTLGSRNYGAWIWETVLSMLAVVLLPRQWQMTFVENVDERHLVRATWLFPLYLLAINVFVLPIALGGLLHFRGVAGANPDTFVLTLPMSGGHEALTLFAFLGGLGAATGMIIVETVALSTMVSNSLVVPLLLRRNSRLVHRPDLSRLVLAVRRAAIVAVVLLGYGYFRVAGNGESLASIGLISFAAVAQFAPPVLGGLFWKGGTRDGVLAGLVGGFLLWAYTLLLPTFAGSGWPSQSFVTRGPFGISALRPGALFGLSGMDQISNAMFWTMLVNIGCYVGVSLVQRPSAQTARQADLFVETSDRSAWRAPFHGQVSVGDLRALTVRVMGADGADKAWRDLAAANGSASAAASPGHPKPTAEAEPELVEHVETLLGGVVGTASARLVLASVVRENPIPVGAVMEILDEASHIGALEERHRLARELHDSVSQTLFSMTLRTRALQLAVEKFGGDPTGIVAAGLSELKELTQDSLTEMRALIFQLRPEALHEEGLVAAVRKHAAAVASQQRLDIRVQAADPRPPLGEHAEHELFRIVQEALNNCVKHADPQLVVIGFERSANNPGTLVIRIQDDGVGFQPEAPRRGHLGLSSMRERAARIGADLTVSSSSRGTVVRVALPGVFDNPSRTTAPPEGR